MEIIYMALMHLLYSKFPLTLPQRDLYDEHDDITTNKPLPITIANTTTHPSLTSSSITTIPKCNTIPPRRTKQPLLGKPTDPSSLNPSVDDPSSPSSSLDNNDTPSDINTDAMGY
eukprot:327955_1